MLSPDRQPHPAPESFVPLTQAHFHLPSYENLAWPCPRLESCPQDTSARLRRFSPSSGSPLSNSVPLGATYLPDGAISVSLDRMEFLLQESGIRYLIRNVYCPLIWELVSGSQHMDSVHEIILFLELTRYLETSVKKPRLCLSVHQLASVTFSGEINLFSNFSSGAGKVSSFPSDSHHQCHYTRVPSALVRAVLSCFFSRADTAAFHLHP